MHGLLCMPSPCSSCRTRAPTAGSRGHQRKESELSQHHHHHHFSVPQKEHFTRGLQQRMHSNSTMDFCHGIHTDPGDEDEEEVILQRAAAPPQRLALLVSPA